MTLVGVGLLGSSLGGAFASGSPIFVQSPALAVLVVVSTSIVIGGLLLARSDVPAWATTIVAGWTVGAVVVSGSLGAASLAFLIGGLETGQVFGAGVYLGTIGGTAGLSLGYNDARRRVQARTARSVSAAMQQSTDAMAILAPDRTVKRVNEAFVDLYGFDDADAIVDRDWRRCHGSDDVASLESAVLPELSRTGTWRGETTGVRADGESFAQELSLTRLEDGETIAVVRDVTGRKARDREVERLALEGTSTGIWEWNLSTDEVVWNESLERLLGLNPGEFGGTFEAFAERVHPEDLSSVETAVERAIEETGEYQAEFRMEHADGSVRWVEGRASVVGVGDDRRLVGIITDITDRKERVSALDEATRRLHLALGGASPAIWEWNMETDEILWNESMARTLEYEPGEFDGTLDSFVAMIHPDDRGILQTAIDESTATESVSTTKLRVADADGEYRWLDLRGKQFLDVDGVPRMVGLARDVTERETYRRERDERERQLSSLIDSLPGVVYSSENEPGWPMSFVGGEVAELTGYPTHALADGTVTWGDIILEADQEPIWNEVQEALDARESYELTYRIRTADGDQRWVWEQGHGVYDETDELLALEGFVTDITDRYEYQQELERRRESIETLHDSTRTMIDAEDAESVCVAAVETAERALDAPLAAIWLANDVGDQLNPVATTDASADRFDELPTYSADRPSHSWDAYESGTVSVTTDTATTSGVANPETPVQSEIILPVGDRGVMNVGTTDDREFDDVDVYIGRLLASNVVAALERARREDELRRQADQLEFFNSILRHDVLNGMTVIQARAEILADTLDGQDREYAETILTWCENVTEVTGRVQQVLETLTSADEETVLEPIDVSALLETHVDRLEQTHSGVTFETDVPDAVVVDADNLLSDVLGNLLTNAIEHSDESDLTVRTSVRVGDEVVTIRIADDGPGVPDERKDSIFRRGETSHAKESGSGFGLFFVDAMITKYGGEVRVTDNENGGATFVIELDRSQRSADDARSADPTSRPTTDTQ